MFSGLMFFKNIVVSCLKNPLFSLIPYPLPTGLPAVGMAGRLFPNPCSLLPVPCSTPPNPNTIKSRTI
jgi:hypothetical protein